MFDDDCGVFLMFVGLDDWTVIAGDPKRFMWIEVMILFQPVCLRDAGIISILQCILGACLKTHETGSCFGTT